MTTDGRHVGTLCLVVGTTGPSAGWLRGNFGLMEMGAIAVDPAGKLTKASVIRLR